jgi:SAM-dependent methyltransferase
VGSNPTLSAILHHTILIFMRHDFAELSRLFEEVVRGGVAHWLSPDSAHYQITLQFAIGRLVEGEQLAEFFRRRNVSGRVLDLGAGNGGVSVGMANYPAEYSITTLDIVPNNDLRTLREKTGLPMTQTVGSGHYLPYKSESFDLVLCLDTIEHVPEPKLLAPEIMRVLKPGGLCMITTPPRLRYWFARDPHYGIPALCLLPDGLQRVVGKWRLGGKAEYDVVHIFWSVGELARLFPGDKHVEVLFNRQLQPQGNLFERIAFRMRDFFWDRIVITKR